MNECKDPKMAYVVVDNVGRVNFSADTLDRAIERIGALIRGDVESGFSHSNVPRYAVVRVEGE